MERSTDREEVTYRHTHTQAKQVAPATRRVFILWVTGPITAVDSDVTNHMTVSFIVIYGPAHHFLSFSCFFSHCLARCDEVYTFEVGVQKGTSHHHRDPDSNII